MLCVESQLQVDLSCLDLLVNPSRTAKPLQWLILRSIRIANRYSKSCSNPLKQKVSGASILKIWALLGLNLFWCNVTTV